MLDQNPGNADALAGIAKIEEHYVGRAQSALDRSRPDAVLRWVERLELINPEHPQVEELQAHAEELRGRLAAEDELRKDVESHLKRGRIDSARSRLEAGRKLGMDSKLVAVLEEKIKQAEDAAERVWLDGISQVQSMLDSGAVAAARDKYEELVRQGLDDERRAGLESGAGRAGGRDRATAW